jgi:hypothetical protein
LDSSQHLGEGLGVTAAGKDEWRTMSAQLWDDKAELTKSGSADKENEHLADKHEHPESENELQESLHGRNAPDDQDTGNGCICRAHGMT